MFIRRLILKTQHTDQLINEHLKNYPVMSLWRLLIDVPEQEMFGPHWMETEEPGYLKSMFYGLNFMLETISEPLCIDYLVELHDRCVAFIQKKFIVDAANGIEEYFESFPKGLRENYGVEFGLIAEGPTSNCSKKGIAELLHKMAAGDDYFTIQTENCSIFFNAKTVKAPVDDKIIEQVWSSVMTGCHIISINGLSKTLLANRLNLIISRYNENISKASTDIEKIKAIAICIHDHELTHPFPDGNCRTFAVLLLNKLLIQQGFTPAILTCRDRFDAYSIEELVQEIYVGMDNFIRVQHSVECNNHQLNIIYCHNNPIIARLLANVVLFKLPQWNSISQGEKTKVRQIIERVFASSSIDALNYEQLQAVLGLLSMHIQKAIYKKSSYQSFSLLFGLEKKSHGIHFDSLINQHLHSNAISYEKLMDVIRIEPKTTVFFAANHRSLSVIPPETLLSSEKITLPSPDC